MKPCHVEAGSYWEIFVTDTGIGSFLKGIQPHLNSRPPKAVTKEDRVKSFSEGIFRSREIQEAIK